MDSAWATWLAVGLVPLVAVVVTSFAKIAIVLAVLRNALGAPDVPPSLVNLGLALVLTAVIMAPVAERIAAELDDAQAPVTLADIADRARAPLRDFLAEHAHPRERQVFAELAGKLRGAAVASDAWIVLVPAFITSELKHAFAIGFLLFVPFLIVDLVVASVLLALGMNALSPQSVALPLKLLLFVAADGWVLLSTALIAGYSPG